MLGRRGPMNFTRSSPDPLNDCDLQASNQAKQAEKGETQIETSYSGHKVTAADGAGGRKDITEQTYKGT